MHKRLVTGVVVCALALASCGSSSKSASPTTAGGGSGTATTISTELGTGVTATTITVGVMMIDFDCIKDFVDQLRPDQQRTYQIFIDDINNKGGINGRKIVPVFKTYCPIGNAGELAACTSLTEDHHVFAAIGVFYDPSGDAQLCFAKEHHTVVVADELTQDLVDRAPPGTIVTPDIIPERRLKVIMSLLEARHTLDGKKVAVVSDAADHARVGKVVTPALGRLHVTRGTDATLSIVGQDTTAAQTQLDSFIERWKSDGTNALVLVGQDVSAKQFIEKIKREIPAMTLVSDTTSVLQGAQDEQKAHVSPNPYDGIITAEGQTGVEHSKTPHGTFCRTIWEKATGRKVPSPDVVVKLPNGKQNDIYGEVEDGCLFPNFFATIARRVGKYLNVPNWQQTVNDFGAIDDMSTIYASIHRGKYDADNTYGLVAYDPTIGDAGDWRHVTPVQDVGGT